MEFEASCYCLGLFKLLRLLAAPSGDDGGGREIAEMCGKPDVLSNGGSSIEETGELISEHDWNIDSLQFCRLQVVEECEKWEIQLRLLRSIELNIS